jgi:hypothetical protein
MVHTFQVPGRCAGVFRREAVRTFESYAQALREVSEWQAAGRVPAAAVLDRRERLARLESVLEQTGWLPWPEDTSTGLTVTGDPAELLVIVRGALWELAHELLEVCESAQAAHVAGRLGRTLDVMGWFAGADRELEGRAA